MLVSAIVPCRNEVGYIDAFLDSVLGQVLPAGMALEVVVADGLSDDGTRGRLQARREKDSRLVIVDNPHRITSRALNIALDAAHGSIIVRMDVHTRYAPDYVARCVEALQTSGATCVGGAWRPVGEGPRQRAIALAFESRYGSGGAASRRTDYEGPVDTVYLGAWRRCELLALGGFDESLVRNQDDELNLRIIRSGGKVWQSRAIRCWYSPRDSFRDLFRQFFQYGYWKVPVIRKHRLPASPRHLAPISFLVVLVGSGVLGLWRFWAAALFLILVSAYVIAGLVVALADARVRREPRLIADVMIAFACMHFGYGIGFARGLLDFLLLKRAPAASATQLTRGSCDSMRSRSESQ